VDEEQLEAERTALMEEKVLTISKTLEKISATIRVMQKQD